MTSHAVGSKQFNLAIETSQRQGFVSLGCGDDVLATEALKQVRRHNAELMPTIARLCERFDASPSDLRDVYMSIGPGSFTGLRIAVATVKMLAYSLGVRIVAVPTLDVLAANVLHDYSHLAVCLNLKRESVYSGLYESRDERWCALSEPALRTIEQIDKAMPAKFVLLGDPLPEFESSDRVTRLPAELAVPRSDVVYTLGRGAAQRGAFVSAEALVPMYVRPPEAVEVWEKNQSRAR